MTKYTGDLGFYQKYTKQKYPNYKNNKDLLTVTIVASTLE